MDDKTEDNLLEGFILGERVKDFNRVKKISHAWRKVHRKGRKGLGKKNYISRESYINWVRARASKDKLPYPPKPFMCTSLPESTHITMEEAIGIKAII